MQTTLKRLFFQCQFKSILDLSAQTGEEGDFYYWKARAFFELHEMDMLAPLLEQARTKLDERELLILEGTLDYFTGEHDRAENKFLKLIELPISEYDRYRSLLGLANVHYSEKRIEKLAVIISEMESFHAELGIEDQIIFKCLKANQALCLNNYELVSQLFLSALSCAVSENLKYLTIRCYYGLATLSSQKKEPGVVKRTIELLEPLLHNSECFYIRYLVNERFKDELRGVGASLELNSKNKEVTVWGKTISLEGRPLIFEFLNFIFNRDGYASKEQIAEALWPNEEYYPTIHDQRIFDLARRARQSIEKNSEQPIVLISGRSGYKLVKQL